jgi:UDP-glucose 4-epimerase
MDKNVLESNIKVKKKILILGGTGYLGSNIAINLSKECDITVTGKQPLNIFLKENLLKNNIQYKKLKLADLRNNLEYIENFHQIVFAIPNLQPHISRPFFHSDYLNIVGPTKKIFKFASSKNIKVIFLSSGGSVYGNNNQAIQSEISNLEPVTKYGKIKLILDNYLINLNSELGAKNVSIRISNPYGGTFNNMYKQGFINMLIHNINNCKPIEIWGDGRQIRDFIFMEDLMSFTSLIVNKDGDGIFNCGTGVGHSLSDVVKACELILNEKIPVTYLTSYKEKIGSNILNIDKAKEFYGWSPSFKLESTLAGLLT